MSDIFDKQNQVMLISVSTPDFEGERYIVNPVIPEGIVFPFWDEATQAFIERPVVSSTEPTIEELRAQAAALQARIEAMEA